MTAELVRADSAAANGSRRLSVEERRERTMHGPEIQITVRSNRRAQTNDFDHATASGSISEFDSNVFDELR